MVTSPSCRAKRQTVTPTLSVPRWARKANTASHRCVNVSIECQSVNNCYKKAFQWKNKPKRPGLAHIKKIVFQSAAEPKAAQPVSHSLVRHISIWLATSLSFWSYVLKEFEIWCISQQPDSRLINLIFRWIERMFRPNKIWKVGFCFKVLELDSGIVKRGLPREQK